MPENDNEFGKIIAKAWRDPAFKAALIASPAAALKAEGIEVPAGMAVTVLENTDKQFHLVLPPVPTDELSDEALEAVAGGAFLCQSHSMYLAGMTVIQPPIYVPALKVPALKAEGI